MLLHVRDLVKHWNGGPAPVLDGVELNLPAGMVVAVQGEMGSGRRRIFRERLSVADARAAHYCPGPGQIGGRLAQ